MAMNDDLDDILSDESLFEGFESDDRLFNTQRYKRTVSKLSTSSGRKKMRQGITVYQKLFDRVRMEIASGQRQIKSFNETLEGHRISKKNPIKQGNFYIDNGIMLYIDKIYDPDTLEEVSESTNRRYKVHAIYENGTENHIWLLSLISSLYDTNRHGRFVTELLSDIELMGDTRVTTGCIYVVRYAGQDKRFLNMENLYKIGYAKDVEQRLSFTENQATYLFSKVNLVAKFEIQNLDARLVERYLHHYFSHYQVSLSAESPTGKTIEVREWFVIPLDDIEDQLQKMIISIQTGN